VRKYNFITKKLLIREYSQKRKSPQQISKEIGCSHEVIRRRLKKYYIHIRTNSEAHKKYNFVTKTYLIQEYNRRKKSERQIANQIGCNVCTIHNRLKEYNIPRRAIHGVRLKCSITKKFLIREYSKNKKSIAQIAKELGCSYMAIRDRLIKYSILIRTPNETQKGKNTGKNNFNYIDGRTKVKHYCVECLKRRIYKEIHYTTWRSGNKRCDSCATKKRWQKKEYREKMIRATMKSLNLKPNKSEQRLNNLLNKLLPKKYRFVGDGQIILGGFNPDFINCNNQKKIIELYGDYWHNKSDIKKRDKRRLKTYKKYGYKTLIIWEHELKNPNKLREKILQL